VEILQARVKNGRFILDEPTDLPEGEVVDVVVVDARSSYNEDQMSDEERAALDRSVERGIAQLDAGEYIAPRREPPPLSRSSTERSMPAAAMLPWHHDEHGAARADDGRGLSRLGAQPTRQARVPRRRDLRHGRRERAPQRAL
jgi:hypothetical protein